MTEINVYQKGIARLLQCMSRRDPMRKEVLSCRGELSVYPGTAVLDKLDRLTRSRIGVSFEALCAAQRPSVDIGAMIEEGCFDQIARMWKKACSRQPGKRQDKPAESA